MNTVAAAAVNTAGRNLINENGRDNFKVCFPGASLSISKHVCGKSIDPDELHLDIHLCGEPAIILNDVKDIFYIGRILHKAFPTACVTATADLIHHHHKAIVTREDVSTRSTIGEGEFRMQAQICFSTERVNPNSPSLAAMKI